MGMSRCNELHNQRIGMTFGKLTILEYVGKGTYKCRCACGNITQSKFYNLQIGRAKSCGKCNAKLQDLRGKTIGGLTALEYLGNQMYRCRCNRCGKMYELTASAFKSGIEMCRECANNIQKCAKVDLKGVTVGSVTVQEYIGKSLWKCKCKCGKEINVKTFNLTEALKSGKNYACTECSIELRRNDLTGKTINDWHILEYIGNGIYKCQCKCGDIHEIVGKTIKMGLSKSCRKCGCEKMIETRIEKYGDTATNVKVQRTIEQLNAVANKENLREFIEETYSYKPKAIELSRVLGISECMVLRTIHRFGLEDCIEIGTGSSIENDVTNYIKSIYKGTIIKRDRTVLNGKELDIYIPEFKLAIEVNGSYWHSTIFKDSRYHQDKTIDCAKKGIRLIHIFEYEWEDDEKREKIISILTSALNTERNRIVYARNTVIKVVDNEQAELFLNRYHLQGYTRAQITLGCYYENELLGVMSFGHPRFNSDYQYELIRLSWKSGVRVVGGLEKLFKQFVTEYNPESILTYCDIAKFTGNSYTRIGFKPLSEKPITSPNYVWLDVNTNETLTRYQTQKATLVKLGLGSENETEDEIMYRQGFLKIHDCGNIRLEWKREQA